MAEFIVLETGYPGAVKQEVVGELVRCKDCKWDKRTVNGRIYYCKASNLYTRTEDDFCSRAERREEGETDD